MLHVLRCNSFREQNVELDNVHLDDYSARHIALMTKVLTLPEDGHCVLLGLSQLDWISKPGRV